MTQSCQKLLSGGAGCEGGQGHENPKFTPVNNVFMICHNHDLPSRKKSEHLEICSAVSGKLSFEVLSGAL